MKPYRLPLAIGTLVLAAGASLATAYYFPTIFPGEVISDSLPSDENESSGSVEHVPYEPPAPETPETYDGRFGVLRKNTITKDKDSVTLHVVTEYVDLTIREPLLLKEDYPEEYFMEDQEPGPSFEAALYFMGLVLDWDGITKEDITERGGGYTIIEDFEKRSGPRTIAYLSRARADDFKMGSFESVGLGKEGPTVGITTYDTVLKEVVDEYEFFLEEASNFDLWDTIGRLTYQKLADDLRAAGVSEGRIKEDMDITVHMTADYSRIEGWYFEGGDIVFVAYGTFIPYFDEYSDEMAIGYGEVHIRIPRTELASFLKPEYR